MLWKKKGIIFSPLTEKWWMRSHASLPVSRLLEDNIRIYFSSRDNHNRSHIGYFETKVDQPEKVTTVAEVPILAPGPLGYFDDGGVYCASLVKELDSLYMYYIGWNPGIKPPMFTSAIGLAISTDNGRSFKRISPAPILARSEYDPCLVTSPFVMKDRGIWRMWYVSGFRWDDNHGEVQSYYHIKHAESRNGIDWKRDGHVCIDHKNNERNIARPCVLRIQDLYHMWYSYSADDGYQIGYATSKDGMVWQRKDDQAGIARSKTGWDSSALAYPWVEIIGEQALLFYNGNDYGRDGIGLAVEKTSNLGTTYET